MTMCEPGALTLSKFCIFQIYIVVYFSVVAGDDTVAVFNYIFIFFRGDPSFPIFKKSTIGNQEDV